MKSSIFAFRLEGMRMFTPDIEKGERNPYTKGDEIGNPFMKKVHIPIKDEDLQDLLLFLKEKGYDVPEIKKKKIK